MTRRSRQEPGGSINMREEIRGEGEGEGEEIT